VLRPWISDFSIKKVRREVSQEDYCFAFKLSNYESIIISFLLS
jgi:hypothetical protein